MPAKSGSGSSGSIRTASHDDSPSLAKTANPTAAPSKPVPSEHLAHSQRAPPAQPCTGDHSQIPDHADVNTAPISAEELEEALRKAAKNKAAGVDDITTEAWQWLETSNLQYLSHLLTGHSTGMADSLSSGDLQRQRVNDGPKQS